jgi:hypothetical protein
VISKTKSPYTFLCNSFNRYIKNTYIKNQLYCVKNNFFILIYKRYIKLKGQSRMNNPETQVTLGTGHRTKTNKTIKHNTGN